MPIRTECDFHHGLLGYTPHQNVPILTESSIQTVVLLEPGKAAVLGGLSRKSEVTERSGIPLLKEIPGIRYLFSREVARTRTSQIIITISLDRAPAGITPDAPLAALPRP